MMKIQVFGSGCPTCRKLYELAARAVEELNLKEKVEYSTDVSKIVEMGVMSSPVLALDGKPVLVGVVPDIKEIKNILTNKNNLSLKSDKCACGGKCRT